MYDTIIHGGTIVDGTGSAPYRSDVAIRDGIIVAIAPRIEAPAAERIDAAGCIVTPGFIDIHTHYDGQVSWDDAIEPSSSHGVTTVLMGNCGVGFAPCWPEDRDRLIEIMESVEDIPGTALHEGLRWDWETFPQYLDALGRRGYALDIAALVPHAPLRLYVMGDRGAANLDATAEDLRAMAGIVAEALAAGAMGVSTSRVLEHQTLDGEVIPGTVAAEEELMALAGAVREAGHGIFQAVPAGVVGGHAIAESAGRLLEEVRLLAHIALDGCVPVTFTLLQTHEAPDDWREALAICERAAAQGATIRPQVAARAPGTLSTLAGYHPFQRRATYLAEVAHLPLDAKLERMRRPDVRARILADPDVAPEETTIAANRHIIMRKVLPTQFIFGADADYEPAVDRTMSALAAAAGMTLEERAYDALLEQEGRAMLFQLPLNYAAGDYSAVAEMLRHPLTLNALSDAGAHVQVICDGSLPTFSLTFWTRDRKRGERLPLEFIVRKLTADNAEILGLADRGRIAVGLRADINVIDMDRLALQQPILADDLPSGGRRMLQGAQGYVATLIVGVVTRRDDRDTGARPGRLVRSSLAATSNRQAPALAMN